MMVLRLGTSIWDCSGKRVDLQVDAHINSKCLLCVCGSLLRIRGSLLCICGFLFDLQVDAHIIPELRVNRHADDTYISFDDLSR